MRELKNWTEMTRGLYRYVIGSKVCYEIHMIMWNHDTNMLASQCNLYLVGEWRTMEGCSYFERELLLTGPLAACLEAAYEDDKENNK